LHPLLLAAGKLAVVALCQRCFWMNRPRRWISSGSSRRCVYCDSSPVAVSCRNMLLAAGKLAVVALCQRITAGQLHDLSHNLSTAGILDLFWQQQTLRLLRQLTRGGELSVCAVLHDLNQAG
jgi:hypothetical protein